MWEFTRRFCKAAKSDHGILLHLDSKTRTEIDEFSMAGLVGIKTDGYIVVVPYPQRAVESVTSDSVREIAKGLGWRSECRTVGYDELQSYSEVLAGTLVPIKSIARKSTDDMLSFDGGSGDPGPCCARLLSILRGIQQGMIEDRFGWCGKVTEVEG